MELKFKVYYENSTTIFEGYEYKLFEFVKKYNMPMLEGTKEMHTFYDAMLRAVKHLKADTFDGLTFYNGLTITTI